MTTLTEYQNHCKTIKENPEVSSVYTSESIHRDEFDSFDIACMNNGEQFIIGYADPGHGFNAEYTTYPLGEIPIITGQGCWGSLAEHVKKQHSG